MLFIYGIPAVIICVCAVRTVYFRLKRLPAAPDRFTPYAGDPHDLERFQKLLRIKTVSCKDTSRRDISEFRKFPGYITSSFPEIIKHLEFHQESTFGCYLIWKGKDAGLKPGLFLAHFDVVGVENQHWTMDPFGGDLYQGYVWGRGAIDTKNTVAGILCAIDALLRDGYTPERTLYFAFGGDEELMGTEGAGSISRTFREKGVFFEFVLDEGSIVASGMVPGIPGKTALIGIGEKGIASFILKTKGRGGHSAHPPAVTPGGRLARALYRLEKYKSPIRCVKEVRKFLEGTAPYVPLYTAVLFSNLWLFRGLIAWIFSFAPASAALVRTTRSITVLKGSDADNILPQAAEGIINCRLLPGDTVIRALERCKRVVRDKEVEICVDEMTAGDPVGAASLEMYPALEAVVRKVFPDAVVAPHLVTASTDSKHFADISAQLYRFVPMVLDEAELRRIHGSDERISLENFYRGIEFFKEAMRGLS